MIGIIVCLLGISCLANVEGIIVEIKDTSGKVVQTLFSNATGYYESELLPAGEYTITIYPQNTTPITKTVLVDGNENVCNFELVSGSIAGALVQLYKDGSKELVAQITTKEDGSFEFANLPLGKYQMVISKQGYISKSISIELTEEKTFECFESLEREVDKGLPLGSPYEILQQDSEALIWLAKFVESGLAPGFPYELNPERDSISRLDAAVVLARVLGSLESKPIALSAEEKKAIGVLEDQFHQELRLIGAFGVSDETEKMVLSTKLSLYQIEREKEELVKKQRELANRLGTTSVVRIKSIGNYECIYDENQDTSKLLDVTVRPELLVQSEPSPSLNIVAVLRSFYNFAGTRGLSWRRFSVNYQEGNTAITFGDFEAKLTPYTFWSYNPTPIHPYESELESFPRKIQLLEHGLYNHFWTLRGFKTSLQKGPLAVQIFGAPTLGKTSAANGQFVSALNSDLKFGNTVLGLYGVSIFDDKLSTEPEKGSMSNTVISLVANYQANILGKMLSLGLESAFSKYQEQQDAELEKATALCVSLDSGNFNFKLINNPKGFYALLAQSIGASGNLHDFYTIGGELDNLVPEAFTLGQATPNRKGWILGSNFEKEGIFGGEYLFSLASASENEATNLIVGLQSFKTLNFGFSKPFKSFLIFKYPTKVGLGGEIIESRSEELIKRHINYGANLKVKPNQDLSVLASYSLEKTDGVQNRSQAYIGHLT